MMRAKVCAEFLGTFVLVTTIGLVAFPPGDAGPFAPIAIGSALMVMIYAGGHISGAHYNPAVTLAVFLRGKMSSSEVFPYFAAQTLGAVAAALVIEMLKEGAAPVPAQPDFLRALLAEFVFTFVLCYVVLNVATEKANEGNSFYGLAIGFTVVAGAYSVGAISGGVFNPAVAIGITLLGHSAWGNIGIFFAANLAGAVAASWAMRAMSQPAALPAAASSAITIARD